jgi:hypothetical protein
MASLGGLDVAFGSSMQIVRTNTLVIETDGTTTKAMAEMVHSVASRKYPAALRPDFTAFVTDGALTEGYATVLTDQVEGNILKDITAVPLSGSQFDAAASTRGMQIEAVLSAGLIQIGAGDVGVADDLFISDISEKNADGTEGVDSTPTDAEVLAEFDIGDNFSSVVTLQGQLMKAIFDGHGASTVAGNHGVNTLNLTNLLADSQILGAAAVTTALDALTEDTTAAALNDAIAGKGGIVSTICLGRIY